MAYFLKDDALIEAYGIPVDEYVRRSGENLKAYAQTRRRLLAGGEFSLDRSVEYGSLIVHSMTTGRARAVYGNVKNTGPITNLPDGCCVEVPVLVDGTGLRPLPGRRFAAPVRRDLRPAHRRPEPDLPGGARRTAGPRPPRGHARQARPERALPGRDSRHRRRAYRGPRRRHARGDKGVGEPGGAPRRSPPLVLNDPGLCPLSAGRAPWNDPAGGGTQYLCLLLLQGHWQGGPIFGRLEDQRREAIMARLVGRSPDGVATTRITPRR